MNIILTIVYSIRRDKMEKEYIKESTIKEKSDKEKDLELITSIIKTKSEVENARKNFEFADGELIDYYLYYIKASQAKLNYLLKKAKKQGMALDMINELYLRKFKVV